MYTSTWVAIYLPLFATFFLILSQQNRLKNLAMFKNMKRKGLINMTNEVINKYIGKNCKISTGSFGTTVKGKIIEVKENWIEVQTKNGNELINADYIQSVKIM